MTTVLSHPLLSQFQCLGDKCEDTCCQNWSMQVDEKTHTLYQNKAPELLAAVEAATEAPWIMHKNPDTGFCIKLEGGLCGIHKNYGDKFLGDACHFYPRVTRALGTHILMTATMSCPEIARLALFDENNPQLIPQEIERLPESLKDYAPAEIEPKDALAIHQCFLDATNDKEADAELIFLRIACASRQLEKLAPSKWPILTSFYLKDADLRIPVATRDITDAFNILHTLCGIIVASHKPAGIRLQQTIQDMETALASTLDWQSVSITTSDQSLASLEALQHSWATHAHDLYTPMLRRWLHMQISLNLFPFAGLGSTLTERVTLLGMRLAIVKLAVICAHQIHGALSQTECVRIVQSLSRLLDHLGDPAFSLSIAVETAWISESRMHGLLRL